MRPVVVVQLLSCVWLFVTPWTAANQASLSFAISQNLLKWTLSPWCCLTISPCVDCSLKDWAERVMATLRTMSLCNLEKDWEHPLCCSMQKKEFFWWNTGGLFQWSPTFLAPGTCFVEGNFSMDGSCAGGWFQDDSKALHLFYLCFISNLMLPLIWQEVPVHGPEVEDPCLKQFSMQPFFFGNRGKLLKNSRQSPGNVKVLPHLPLSKKILERKCWDFPGVPVVKTPCLQCRGPGFYPWSGN